MPFLDSPTIRPLYDVHDGGPPLGFRCMINQCQTSTVTPNNENCSHGKCGRVTRTLRGMVQHQRMIHGIKQQQEFNFESLTQADQQNR